MMPLARLALLAVLTLVTTMPPPAPARAPAMVTRLVILPPSRTSDPWADHVDVIVASQVNATAELKAFAFMDDGTVKLVAPTWSSSNTTAASVTVAGVVRAKAQGTSKITAQYAGAATTILACVSDPTRVAPTVKEQSHTATTSQFVAQTGTYIWPQPCVHWSVSDTTAAVIDRRGVLYPKPVAAAVDISVTAFLGVCP